MKTADINRRIENLLRLGTIAELDTAARQVRVRSGNLLTDWLPWPAEIGRNYIRWRPLRQGTQVILGCISGEPEQATIIGMLYTQTINSPSTDPDVDLIQFDDGTRIQHNSKTHTTTVQSAGDMTIHAAGNLGLTADGNIIINGTRVDIN